MRVFFEIRTGESIITSYRDFQTLAAAKFFVMHMEFAFKEDFSYSVSFI